MTASPKTQPVTLLQIQDALIARLVAEPTRHQGFAKTTYKKQAKKMGYNDQTIRVQIHDCYDMADLYRNAR